MLKHTGEYPIIGVNTFLSSEGSPTLIPGEVIRATSEEKEGQIQTLVQLHRAGADQVSEQLKKVKKAAISNENVFEYLMEASKFCSLGQLTQALYEVGGQYRRNM
jgi:methylmalonyl-CoA mutase